MRRPAESAAILTLMRPSQMTPAGRKNIARWLTRQASFFLKYGDIYNDHRYCARYLYPISENILSTHQPADAPEGP